MTRGIRGRKLPATEATEPDDPEDGLEDEDQNELVPSKRPRTSNNSRSRQTSSSGEAFLYLLRATFYDQ